MHILVQHEVEDFEVWKKVYDEDEPARAAAGFKEITLYQGLDNPNNVVAIFFNDDVEIISTGLSYDLIVNWPIVNNESIDKRYIFLPQ